MQKKKIVLIIDFMIIGGVEKVLLQAVSILNKKYDVTVYLLSGRIDEEVERELLEYVHLVKLHLNLSSRWMFILFSLPIVGGIILDYIIKDKFDYCISCRRYFVNASYCHIAPIKIFWDHSDGNILYQDTKGCFRKINKIRLKMAYKKYDSIWVLNEEIQSVTKRAFGLPNVYVLNNPINCDEIIHLSNQRIDEYLCNCQNTPNIICVGRISPEKGQYRLLKIVQKIKQQAIEYFSGVATPC